MKFLPEGIRDVNQDPGDKKRNDILEELLRTSDRVCDLHPVARVINRKFAHCLDGARENIHTVFLYGGDGYVGRNIQPVLEQLGFHVVSMINTSDGVPCAHDRVIHLACPRKSTHILETKNWIDRASSAMAVEGILQQYTYPDHCLYFSSQSIFDSPASSVYSQHKQRATDHFQERGWQIFAPGTIFGTIGNGPLRTDTAVNGIVDKAVRNQKYHVTETCRCFMAMPEVVEAVVAFLCGLSIEPYQCWNTGRTWLKLFLSSDQKLSNDTGCSLKNFMPYTHADRTFQLKRYLQAFMKHVRDHDRAIWRI